MDRQEQNDIISQKVSQMLFSTEQPAKIQYLSEGSRHLAVSKVVEQEVDESEQPEKPWSYEL